MAHLQAKGLKPTSINSSLQVLRRVLRVAVEWGISPSAPNIKMLREAHQRDRVVTREEEARYLAAADELLADVATVLVDTGMRPEENSRLRWERISWASGQQGALQVTHGKTAAARDHSYEHSSSSRPGATLGSRKATYRRLGVGRRHQKRTH